MNWLSIAAIVKNEARYLREWIEFHRLMGVEHFYIYDNGSTDGTRELLEPYQRAGLVDVSYWPGAVQQMLAYVHAVECAVGETEWLAVLDADEFLWTPRGSYIDPEGDGQPLYNVADVLGTPEFCEPSVPALAVNWSVFGTGGHEVEPDGLVIESYTRCVEPTDPVNRHIKSIVKPELVVPMIPPDPHHFVYEGERVARNEEGCPVRGPLTDVWAADTFRVNHYWSKSVEHAREKAGVTRADNGMLRRFEEMVDSKYNAREDTGITVHVPALKAALAVAPR